ncbi:MAG: phosphate ABC transporter permease PstA [Pedosphaera sp.]|nr:phosphate ABC transporter permease PstA [Pedosphaera sp.]
MQTIPNTHTPEPVAHFHRSRFDAWSFLFTGVTGACTYLTIAILLVILGNIVLNGYSHFSWRFLTGGADRGMYDPETAGVLPMIVGTASRIILMTFFVIPVGVITALYMTEYAHSTSLGIRIIRGAVANLAGVPSIVFGLFGWGFFLNFIGTHMDQLLHPEAAKAVWGKPALIWASLTLAVMTLPVVIVATEEALKSIPHGLREASLALGATKLQTVLRIVLPQAMPGILTGGILAISRAAGEVAPILFTGAVSFYPDLPKALTDPFMDLGYHVFILSTQSPNIEQTRPLLYATVMALLLLTFLLNIMAILVRAQMRRKLRALQ